MKFPGSPWQPKGDTLASSDPGEIAIRQGPCPKDMNIQGDRQADNHTSNFLLCTEEPQFQSTRCYLVLGVGKVRSAET